MWLGCWQPLAGLWVSNSILGWEALGLGSWAGEGG